MPTVRGWAALGAAGAMVLLWIGFGEVLLLAVAGFLILSVVFGTVFVRWAAPRTTVTRVINPRQVHVGDRAIVDLQLTSARRVRHIAVEDEVHGLGSARFLAEEIAPGDPVGARYEVLCRPRGVYRVGPAAVTVRDPLELTEAGDAVGTTDQIVVYPVVEDLAGLPVVRGQDPSVNATRANFSHTGGDDFFTLREYQQGDDLRRVHWPSSARRDELMIKQLEMPWQSRAFVVLDNRAASYQTADDFEHAVSGAASVVRHLYGNGFSPSLWVAGTDTAAVRTVETYRAAMEALAIVQQLLDLDLESVVSRLRRSGVSGGALVIVTGRADEATAAAYRVLSRDFIRTVVMASTEKPSEAILQMQNGGAVPVICPAGRKWAPEWRDAMERAWSTATAG